MRMWPRVGSGGGHARGSLFPCRLWPEDQPGCQPYLYGLFPASAGPGLFLSPRLHLAYLLCEALVSRERMSRPWDGEVSGQERQGAWVL